MSGQLKSWECVLDDQKVGHCSGNSRTGQILGLMVLPAYEGNGIGSKLLSTVVEWLSAEGTNRIWLEGPADPQLRAHRFYRSRGWVPTGESVGDGLEIFELAGNMPIR
jgi:GNAT superfamily N-acetyltransferase